LGIIQRKYWGGGVGVNTVKTLKIEKGGECLPPPSAPMVAPPLTTTYAGVGEVSSK